MYSSVCSVCYALTHSLTHLLTHSLTYSFSLSCSLTLHTGKNGGAAGNLCQVDCANRGLCNSGSGLCQCFNGFYGLDCTSESVLATYAIWG